MSRSLCADISSAFVLFKHNVRYLSLTFVLFKRVDFVICFFNYKNYNFLACDWFKNVLFSTNSLVKLLSDSLLLDSLLLDSLLSDSLR